MNEVPQTQYVAVGDADVAYQVFGDGPIDVVYFYGLGNHIDLLWTMENDRVIPLLRRLSSFARIILLIGAAAGPRVVFRVQASPPGRNGPRT